MTNATTIPDDPTSRSMVERKLRDAWHKERRFHHFRGLCILAIWIVALILLDLLIDWLFLAGYRAPGWARMVLLGLNVIALCVVAWRYWLRHLRRYEPVRVALEFERKHPELRSLLVSYVQIDERSEQSSHASPALVAALRREAISATRPLNFKEVVSYRMLARLMVFSLATVAVFAGVSFYKSEFFRTLLRRMLNPVSELEYPTRTVIRRVTGDVSVPQGSPLRLTAVCGGELPEAGRLEVKADDAEWEQLVLLPGRIRGQYGYSFSDARRSFEYIMHVGDDESERHRVEVIPAPKVVAKAIRLEFPPHTGLPADTRDSYYLEVPEGTTVTWHLTLDRAVSAGEMRLNFDDANTLAMTVEPGGKNLTLRRRTWKSFDYELRWVEAEHGFRYEPPGVFTVNVIPDMAPEIQIVEPLEDEKATTRKRITVTCEATDDYGLGMLSMVYQVNEQPEQTVEIGPLEGKEVTHTFVRKLTDLAPNVAEGDTVTYYLRVADNRAGDRGPNVGESLKRRLYIVSVEEYLRSILEEQLRWFTEVEELHAEETEAKDTVGELKQTEPPVPEEKEKEE